MSLRDKQTRIFTQAPAGAAACSVVLTGSLLLGGAFTRTQNIAVDALLNNAFIAFSVNLGGVNTGFRSYNISNKAAPVFQGNLAAGADHNIFEAMRLAGTVAFAGGSFGDHAFDVTSIDVSNPLVPAKLNSLVRAFPLGMPTELSIVGNTLYLVDDNSFFSLVDVTLPAAMVTIHNYSMFGDFPLNQPGTTSIVVIGSTAFILSYDQVTPEALFGIYNVTVPLVVTQTSLTHVAAPFAGARRSGLQVVGSRAYTLSDDKLVILDISNLAAPVILSTTTVIADTVAPGEAFDPLFVNAAGTRATVLNESTRTMYTFDVSNPAAPLLLDAAPTHVTSSPESVVGGGGFLFVAETEAPAGSTQGWLEIFDVSACV
jgi:hypothetical protein